MQTNSYGSLRGWEREDAYRRGNRRLFFAFVLLSALAFVILGALHEKLKEDNIGREVYETRRDADDLAEGARFFFEAVNVHLKSLAAYADASLYTALEDEHLKWAAEHVMQSDPSILCVWFTYPSEDTGEETMQIFYWLDGKLTLWRPDDPRSQLDAAWYRKVSDAGAPTVVSAGAGDVGGGEDSIVLSAGNRLPSGRGYVGAEFAFSASDMLSGGSYLLRPAALLLSRDGIYFGLRWHETVYGNDAGDADAGSEIAAALRLMQADGGEREAWEIRKDASGAETLLYCRDIGSPEKPAGWSIVLETPVYWLYREAQEIAIVVFIAVEALLVLIFAVAYFARRRKYYAPEKTSTVAGAENAEPVQLTATQQDYLKKLGRKRTLYRILAVLFFMPIAFGMSLTESRFEKAKAAGDIAAAEKYVRTMRNAAIAAVVIGVPLLVLYIALEF